MKSQKVCPVIVRETNARREVPVFRHPLGSDIQLVKGTVEAGEDLETAARRELREESGIVELSAIEYKGSLEIDREDQVRHFFLCRPAGRLPDTRTFFADEDGGLDFSFCWYDTAENPGDEWHPVFQPALGFVRALL